MGGKETRLGKSFEPVGEREGNREVKGRERGDRARGREWEIEGRRQQNEEGKKRGRVLLFLSVLVMHA